MPISEPTAVFSIRDDRDMEIKQAVLQVYRALEEKGYNPINQLVGYILSEGSDLHHDLQERPRHHPPH